MNSDNLDLFDVLVVGGGPAGLSAALVLGRACRSVLVVDGPRARNDVTDAMHGFLSRDGTPPAEFRRIAREQLMPYDVQVRDAPVVEVRPQPGRPFLATLEDSSVVAARRVLLATGMQDQLPDLPGFDAVYGRSAHHCPYCDGWEWRDQRVAVYAPDGGLPYAHTLRSWTPNVTLLTDGHRAPPAQEVRRLFGRVGGLEIVTAPVSALRSRDGYMTSVEFDGADPVACDAFFFHLGMRQASDLPALLRCRMQDGFVRVDDSGLTSVTGVYAAGDLTPGPQSVAIAVAEGSVVAASIHQDLWREDSR